MPWTVITPEVLQDLKVKALNTVQRHKQERLLLFEYALVYHDSEIFEALQKVGFTLAHTPERGLPLLKTKYFMGYESKNTDRVMNQVK